MALVDSESIRKAVSNILVAVGEDPTREGLQATPDRVAELFGELFSGVGVDPVSVLQTAMAVPSDASERGDLVALRDISFVSVCEHHLLPFEGHASVVYEPGSAILGFGTIATLVDVTARRPQLQERVGEMVTHALVSSGVATGALVLVSAIHGCVAYRGPQQRLTTVTIATAGSLTEGAKRHEALLLAGGEDWE
jgi:GTP cyclohydrolase IA